jgi:hypothetical protein
LFFLWFGMSNILTKTKKIILFLLFKGAKVIDLSYNNMFFIYKIAFVENSEIDI